MRIQPPTSVNIFATEPILILFESNGNSYAACVGTDKMTNFSCSNISSGGNRKCCHFIGNPTNSTLHMLTSIITPPTIRSELHNRQNSNDFNYSFYSLETFRIVLRQWELLFNATDDAKIKFVNFLVLNQGAFPKISM